MNHKNTAFGGELLWGKKKSQRPLDLNKSIHLVLRLKELKLFLPSNVVLRQMIFTIAQKRQIKIYHLILNWTHVHICLKLSSRKAYTQFIRELTSKLVKYFSKQTKRHLKDIFLYRPFTRVVNWGKDFLALKNYFKKNEKESGVVQSSEIKKKNVSKSQTQASQKQPQQQMVFLFESSKNSAG